MVESLYSKLHRPTIIAKQRFVDRFDGDDLDERWTKAGTGAMVDAVDGGYKIDSSGGASTLFFNSIKQFHFDGSETISIWKLSNAGNARAFVGLDDNALTDIRDGPKVIMSNTTNFQWSRLDTSTTSVDTGIVADTVFHLWRLHSEPNNGQCFHNGVLVATGGQNSGQNCQPAIRAQNISTDVSVTIRYFEAFNF